MMDRHKFLSRLHLTRSTLLEDEEHNKQIKLDDNLMMEMTYPSLDQFISNNFDMDGDMNIEKSFELIALVLKRSIVKMRCGLHPTVPRKK